MLGARSWSHNVSHKPSRVERRRHGETRQPQACSQVVMSGPKLCSGAAACLEAEIPEEDVRVHRQHSCRSVQRSRRINKALRQKLCIDDAIGSTLWRFTFVMTTYRTLQHGARRIVSRYGKKGCNRSICRLQVHTIGEPHAPWHPLPVITYDFLPVFCSVAAVAGGECSPLSCFHGSIFAYSQTPFLFVHTIVLRTCSRWQG